MECDATLKRKDMAESQNKKWKNEIQEDISHREEL